MNNLSTVNLEQITTEADLESPNFYKHLIIGQQTYDTLLYCYIFSFVCQNSKQCSRIVKSLSSECILRAYVTNIFGEKIWLSNDYGTYQKIRKSYAILGYSYQKLGFDQTFSMFKSSIENDVSSFLKLPISNYTHLLESYAWNYQHYKIKYDVQIKQVFSDKDITYRAVTYFQDKEYSSLGFNKKDAIEKLAKNISLHILNKNDFGTVVKSQHYLPIHPHRFLLNTSDYNEKNPQMREFCEKYGFDFILARFSMLTRSQMGEDVWNRLGVDISDFIGNTKIPLLKRSLINCGQELILLQVLCHLLENGSFDSLNLSAFDITSANIGKNEIHNQLLKIMGIENFSEFLFKQFDAPLTTMLTSKDQIQLGASLTTAFFLSNFSPDYKFFEFFQPTLDEFYSEQGLNFELDYRYMLITFFSNFNIRIVTNHYEKGDGIYHAEIQLGESSQSPTFVCENESMLFSKKEVWHQAFENTLFSFQHFFIEPEFLMDKKMYLFLSNIITYSTIEHIEFYHNYGILNAWNFDKIGLIHAQDIMKKAVHYFGSSKKYTAFIRKFSSLNRNYYILIENRLYDYSTALANCFQPSNMNGKEIPCTPKTIVKYYSKIVNPTEDIQRQLVDIDYKLIKMVKPLSDTIAKYALDKDPDAYNYLYCISRNIKVYYEQLNAKPKDDFIYPGKLVGFINNDATFYIFDSQKPVNEQIDMLTEHLEIKRVVFACGYCFASGLKLLKNIFERTLYINVPVDFYIGALQNYDAASPDNLITDIDKTTIKMLNEFLCYHSFSLFTCKDRFYHGKLYIFEGKEKTVICMGSSNISRSAYISNYELNIALTISPDSELKQGFDMWVKQLRFYSHQIGKLDESMFAENEMKQDGCAIMQQVSKNSIQQRINELTNTELQYRLNLWMSYAPDIIAEDLGILSLPNYIVFVYQKHKLLVLESFSAGNAYFCIHYDSCFEDVINNIATFSKAEIFEYNQMTKRGYHVSNKFTLESNIRRYFLKR